MFLSKYFSKIDISELLDQLIRKYDAVGSFIGQIISLCLLEILFPQYYAFYSILGVYSTFSFIGKAVGTFFTIKTLSGKKN